MIGCYAFRSHSGNLAILAAIRRASSLQLARRSQCGDEGLSFPITTCGVGSCRRYHVKWQQKLG